jgi:ribosomal protein S18 acetylase RimI-like enzyme
VESACDMKETHYCLRKETLDDKPFLFTLFAATRTLEIALTGWGSEQKDLFLRSQFQLQYLQYHRNYAKPSFNIVYCHGEKAGRLYLNRTRDEIRIIDISLMPTYRGKGLGQKILEDVIVQAGNAGLPVRLSVFGNNPARSLYERLGFICTGDTGAYISMEFPAAVLK